MSRHLVTLNRAQHEENISIKSCSTDYLQLGPPNWGALERGPICNGNISSRVEATHNPYFPPVNVTTPPHRLIYQRLQDTEQVSISTLRCTKHISKSATVCLTSFYLNCQRNHCNSSTRNRCTWLSRAGARNNICRSVLRMTESCKYFACRRFNYTCAKQCHVEVLTDTTNKCFECNRLGFSAVLWLSHS